MVGDGLTVQLSTEQQRIKTHLPPPTLRVNYDHMNSICVCVRV